MPQLIEFPPVTAADPRLAVQAIVKICREMKDGEPFREFRARLIDQKLWEVNDPMPVFRFFGTGGAQVSQSPFMKSVATAKDDSLAYDAVAERLWAVNPPLAKFIFDLLRERPYAPDEIYKAIAAATYHGVVPSRPSLELWLRLARALDMIRPLGIAVTLHTRGQQFSERAENANMKELLAEKNLPEPEIPGYGDEAPSEIASTASTMATSPVASFSAPVAPTAMTAPVAPRWLDGVGALHKFAPAERKSFLRGLNGHDLFPDEVLEETAGRVAAWWKGAAPASRGFTPEDFGLEATTWVENPDELLYRLAVAAALVFRFETDRAGVLASYRTLHESGVLADLYHGTMPGALNERIDARALMLASLVVRRCAEVPDLAVSLEQKKSAAEVFAALESALGRGLFRIELFWLMSMLSKLGVIRHDDLADFTTVPHRLVRDTLFRNGYLSTPYAGDSASLAAAAKAARRMAGGGEPVEVVIGAFALTLGCAYDCPNRKTCDVPCRERIE